MIGQLKIVELRERAETALGREFDIRDFHAVVLENGAGAARRARRAGRSLDCC